METHEEMVLRVFSQCNESITSQPTNHIRFSFRPLVRGVRDVMRSIKRDNDGD